MEESIKNIAIERSLIKTYRKDIYARFILSIKEYNLIEDGDVIRIYIDGTRASFLLAKLFQELEKHSSFCIKTQYVILDETLKTKENIKLMNINAFNNVEENYNKIALAYNYDDVISKTLESILKNGKYETILPKYYGEQNILYINPLYHIREIDILRWKNYNHLSFIDDEIIQNKDTKDLIKYLRKNYNKQVDDNIFISSTNINLDKLLGYIKEDTIHNYLDKYEK